MPSGSSARWAGRRSLERLRQADEGWLPLISRDGIPIYNAFAHVEIFRLDGFRRNPRRRALRAGPPLDADPDPGWRRDTGHGALLGMVIGRRIAGAITALVGYADLVGRGESVDRRIPASRKPISVARIASHLAGERLRQSALERAVLLTAR